MKVAVCFSGLPKFFQCGHRFHTKYLFEKYNPDVFIHSWYNNSPSELDELLALYQPKGVFLQKDNEIVLPATYARGTSDRYPAYNIFSLNKSIMESNRLKKTYEHEHNFKYNWVFRLRFDYALNREFDLDNIDSSFLHFPLELKERNMVTDQFAFSSSQNMDLYSTVFDHLDQYYNTGVKMVGEEMLTHHLLVNGLSDKIQWHDMNHPFYPINGDSMTNSLIRKEVALIRDVQDLLG